MLMALMVRDSPEGIKSLPRNCPKTPPNSAQAPQPAQAAPSVTPVWTVTEGMDSPESAYFDPVSGFLFVSQIGGQAADRDGNGRVVKLTVDGKVVATDWVKGLNAPKGLRSHQGTLYAADIDEVVAVEIATGRILSKPRSRERSFSTT